MYTVYHLWGRDERLLYVGATGQTWPTRIKQHSNVKPWFSEVASLTLEFFDNPSDALNAEAASIKTRQPLYNELHNQSVTATAGGRDTRPPRRRITNDPFSHGTSGIRNVSYHRSLGKWSVQLNKNGRAYRGGYFDLLEDAAEAARELRKEVYGEDIIESSEKEGFH